MVSFYERGSTASRLEPLRGGSLLFTTKFPEIPGTHLIDLERMKGWVNLEPPSECVIDILYSGSFLRQLFVQRSPLFSKHFFSCAEKQMIFL